MAQSAASIEHDLRTRCEFILGHRGTFTAHVDIDCSCDEAITSDGMTSYYDFRDVIFWVSLHVGKGHRLTYRPRYDLVPIASRAS